MRQRYEFTPNGMIADRNGIWVKDIPLVIKANSYGLNFCNLGGIVIASIADAPKWKLNEGCKAVLEKNGYETDFADWSPEGAFWGLK